MSVKKHSKLKSLYTSGKWNEFVNLSEKIFKNSSPAEIGYDMLLAIARARYELKQLALAEKTIFEAINLNPVKTEAPKIYVDVLLKIKNYQKALDIINRILEVESDLNLIINQIKILSFLNRSDEVIEKYECIISDYPITRNNSDLHNAVIMALVNDGRIDDALSHCEANNLLSSNDKLILMAVSAVYFNLGDVDEAIDRLTTAITYHDNAIWYWNRALMRLSVGYLKKGWEDYRHRWGWADFPSPSRNLTIPEWKGENLTGKTIILLGEQGIGDQVMMGVMIHRLFELGLASIRIEVHPKLTTLFTKWYPEIEVMEFDINGKAIDDMKLDFQCYLGDLCGAFLTAPDAAVALNRRYLKVPNERKKLLLKGWGTQYSKLVGLGWRSSVVDGDRIKGYMNSTLVQKVLNNLAPDIGIVILQYQLTEEEITALRELDRVFIPNEDFYDDVALHAEYCGCCDFVISAATLVIPLAGLYGVPTVTWGHKHYWPLLGNDNPPWFRNAFYIKCENYASRSSIVQRLIQIIKILF